MFSKLTYGLGDLDFLAATDLPDYHFISWIPDKIYLVLGQSNKADQSINLPQVRNDGITVYKRPSGGETVLLTPNTIVIASKIREEKFQNPAVYFKNCSQKIMDILSGLGIRKLGMKGISDIAIGNKKILGSSIYRSKGFVYYHAVLNICEDTELMEKYILHPSKEPDYRKGRRHSEFVSSIQNENYPFTVKDIKKLFSSIPS